MRAKPTGARARLAQQTRATATAPSPFVQRCGASLCLAGKPFPMFAASVLSVNDDPSGTMARARAQGLNTVRLVNFLDEHGDPATAPFDLSHWAAVDRAIAAARAAGLKVILDLSTYRNLLAASRNPYTADWGSFLRWVFARKSTTSGIQYKDDPTIALVDLAGEIEAPNSDAGRALGETSDQITAFFTRTAREFKADDPNHVLSTGGLLQLDWDSGIDWRTIGSIASIDMLAIHVYSAADRLKTIPAVSSWARANGKPWMLEEFGLPQRTGDETRANYFGSVFAKAEQTGAAGVGFWNSGPQLNGDSYDVNQATPLTWLAVSSNAPPS
jgi:hypothetical protein